ncbi:MAG: SWIM zinc finger family protein [Candidatus Omnitrophota bacterium]
MRETSKNPSFYVNPSRMINCRKTKDYLEAQVLGTDAYRVKVPIKDKELSEYCSCPAFANFGGSCKHIAAVAMAYEKHPEWFKGFEGTIRRLQGTSKEKLIEIVELIFNSIPEARDVIESELGNESDRVIEYSKKIRSLLAADSMGENSVENLYRRLDSFFQRARGFFKSKDYIPCMGICYEIVKGCLSLDDEWGSTEIFPEGFVSEVWGLYLKALKKTKLSKAELDVIRNQIKKLNNFESYLFDQEGVYPGEAEKILGLV